MKNLSWCCIAMRPSAAFGRTVRTPALAGLRLDWLGVEIGSQRTQPFRKLFRGGFFFLNRKKQFINEI